MHTLMCQVVPMVQQQQQRHIAQSVEHQTLGREVGSSFLPAILVVILGKSLQWNAYNHTKVLKWYLGNVERT